jgi:hypothetical protein
MDMPSAETSLTMIYYDQRALSRICACRTSLGLGPIVLALKAAEKATGRDKAIK